MGIRRPEPTQTNGIDSSQQGPYSKSACIWNRADTREQHSRTYTSRTCCDVTLTLGVRTFNPSWNKNQPSTFRFPKNLIRHHLERSNTPHSKPKTPGPHFFTTQQGSEDRRQAALARSGTTSFRSVYVGIDPSISRRGNAMIDSANTDRLADRLQLCSYHQAMREIVLSSECRTC